jgi:hypothetical protein
MPQQDAGLAVLGGGTTEAEEMAQREEQFPNKRARFQRRKKVCSNGPTTQQRK